MTINQQARTTAEWSEIAKESMAVEEIGGTIYAYGSELACLRLAYKFRYSGDKAKSAFSDNLQTWFFRLETNVGAANV